MARFVSLGRDSVVAVIDIGTGYVGCGVISIPSRGPASILAHARSTLSLEPRTEEQSRARIADEIGEAGKAALAQLARVAPGKHVEKVCVMLHAPWSESKTFIAREAYEGEVAIRDSMISRLAQASVAKAGIDQARLLEASVVTIRLNGYPTHRPAGMHAHELELVSMLSTGDMQLKTNAQSAIEQLFPSARIDWRSSARVHATMMQYMNESLNAIVVGVGVLGTHILVVRDGTLEDERVAHEGLQSILSRVHGTKPAEEALSMFRMLAREACEGDACAAFETALAKAEPELVKIFGDVFGPLAQQKRLPNTLYLDAHQDVTPWLKRFFERIDFTQFTVTALPFSVTPLDSDALAPYLKTDVTMDTVLALGCAYAAHEEQST